MTEVDTLHEENRRLQARIAELEAEARSRTEESPPTESPTPTPEPQRKPSTPPPLPLKEPKISEPPTFDGKASEFHPFLNQCKLFLRMRHITFHNDETRVAYIISRLRGGPAEWGQALLESKSPLLVDYDGFLTRFSLIYENKERKRQLQDKLARMSQTGSAHAFAAEFTSICEILGIDDASRMSLFPQKLKPTLRKALALAPAPATFPELIELAVRIDDVHFTIDKAEKAESRRTNPSPSSKPTLSASSSKSTSHSGSINAVDPQPNSAARSHSQPLSYRRGPLSDQEKERRRREKLCGFCANPKHAITDCPALKAKEAREAARNKESTPKPAVSNVVIAPQPLDSGKVYPQSQ
jgi:hypothetical protein